MAIKKSVKLKKHFGKWSCELNIGCQYFYIDCLGNKTHAKFCTRMLKIAIKNLIDDCKKKE